MKTGLSLLFGALLFASAPSASAQDSDAEPTQGSTTLEAGFDQQSARFEVTAEGDMPAQDEACLGFFSEEPTFEVHYSGSSRLRVMVEGDDAVALLVKGESVVVECDDAGGETASVIVFDAMESNYKIWVGVPAPELTVHATISFSEVAGDQ